MTHDAQSIAIRASLLGERIDTRAFEREGALAKAPLSLSLGNQGVAVVFRYGAVVLFDAEPADEEALLARLRPHVIAPLATPERDETYLRISSDAEEPIDRSGTITLRERSLERLQAVAIVIAKSLLLAHYETRLSAVFDRVEPLAEALASGRGHVARGAELMRHIGQVLLIQHKMVGRAEIRETPELLWDHPELERLYARLAEDYELRDRDRALDRKLDVIARTAETLLGLLQNRSSLRVEWYVLILIVAELLLSIYPPSLWH